MTKQLPQLEQTIQAERQRYLDLLASLEVDSDEYWNVLTRYRAFEEIQTINVSEPSGIKPWIPAIGNVGGIFLMGMFESFGSIFTSKAVSLFGGKLLR